MTMHGLPPEATRWSLSLMSRHAGVTRYRVARIWAEATDTEFVIHAPVEAAEFVRWACRVRVAAALPLAVVAGDRRIVFGEVEG